MKVLWLPGIFLLGVAFALILRRIRERKAAKHIRGPPSPSFIFGNILEFNRQGQSGDLDFKWNKEYGPTWRLNGILGETILMSADPKAMQHIIQKFAYNYPKPTDNNELVRMLTGPGIIYATGEIHRRHRRIMSPAFSMLQLRLYMPVFQRNTQKMVQMWKATLAAQPEGKMDTNVHMWLTRVALDIIGEAAFDYSFGALALSGGNLLDVYTNMFLDTSLYPSKSELLVKYTWKYIPIPILRLMDYLPMKNVKRILQIRNAFDREATQLLKDKTEKLAAGIESKRDVMSVLVKANVSENPKTRLSEAEMVAQMGTITIAGHDTTANTLTWLFFELAKCPAYQTKMRDEIRTVRSAVLARGDTDFSLDDLDSMTYCMAAIKETLRYHPVVPGVRRAATQDDTIPLQYPILSTSGELITEVPIHRGQDIFLSFGAYNRLPELWGENSDVWDPSRFLTQDIKREITVGMFANLMTFSAGPRGCVGWRFSVIETQAILAEIIESFEFSLQSDAPDIQRLPTGVMNPGVMVPAMRGKLESGIQMPLQITVAA
ncbi:cytochrome P450 [Obba rivulosa]|uniref:Cytochrome P450 n=1 Tax=Obba rivulosa TaxID=1052685 RepID=A0A8E2AUB4_9APHY|nr:cytochrome P450 [Obba rivulosa]